MTARQPKVRTELTVVELDGEAVVYDAQSMDVHRFNPSATLILGLLDGSATLEELAVESRQRCSVVEMKFFLGMTDEEAADALGLSLHTFQREWYRARKWLFERLSVGQWTTTPNKTSA